MVHGASGETFWLMASNAVIVELEALGQRGHRK